MILLFSFKILNDDQDLKASKIIYFHASFVLVKIMLNLCVLFKRRLKKHKVVVRTKKFRNIVSFGVYGSSLVKH